jgi:hypothetical protein
VQKPYRDGWPSDGLPSFAGRAPSTSARTWSSSLSFLNSAGMRVKTRDALCNTESSSLTLNCLRGKNEDVFSKSKFLCT